MLSDMITGILITIGGIAYIPSNPSFEQDIRPIFEYHCTKCHEDRWSKYSNVEFNIIMIKKRVLDDKTMPPFDDIGPVNREIIRVWIQKGLRED